MVKSLSISYFYTLGQNQRSWSLSFIWPSLFCAGRLYNYSGAGKNNLTFSHGFNPSHDLWLNFKTHVLLCKMPLIPDEISLDSLFRIRKNTRKKRSKRGAKMCRYVGMENPFAFIEKSLKERVAPCEFIYSHSHEKVNRLR